MKLQKRPDRPALKYWEGLAAELRAHCGKGRLVAVIERVTVAPNEVAGPDHFTMTLEGADLCAPIACLRYTAGRVERLAPETRRSMSSANY